MGSFITALVRSSTILVKSGAVNTSTELWLIYNVVQMEDGVVVLEVSSLSLQQKTQGEPLPIPLPQMWLPGKIALSAVKFNVKYSKLFFLTSQYFPEYLACTGPLTRSKSEPTRIMCNNNYYG